MERTSRLLRRVAFSLVGACIASTVLAGGTASAAPAAHLNLNPRTEPAAMATQAVAAQASLELAQSFIAAVEAKNIDAVAQTLSPTVDQFFMHTLRTKTAQGSAEIISGQNRAALRVAYLRGKNEVLA